jgi:hypothetical protein
MTEGAWTWKVMHDPEGTSGRGFYDDGVPLSNGLEYDDLNVCLSDAVRAIPDAVRPIRIVLLLDGEPRLSYHLTFGYPMGPRDLKPRPISWCGVVMMLVMILLVALIFYLTQAGVIR